MGAQCNGTHAAQNGQRPHEWGPPQILWFSEADPEGFRGQGLTFIELGNTNESLTQTMIWTPFLKAY